jgi:hypothetical protein
MKNEPCKRKGCVAVALTLGFCVLHAAGYEQHDGSKELRCGTCRRQIRNGEWYRKIVDDVRHVKPCPEHPDIERDRLKEIESRT